MSDPGRPIGIDLFSGVGGLSLGFEQAGFDVVAAIDSDTIHEHAHASDFPRTKFIQGDLSHLSGEDIRCEAGIDGREIDALFGGPPCQGFSLIGKREAEDPRNLHLNDFARLVRELRPRYFVLENVAGLLAGDAVRVLESFLRRVRRAGYGVVAPIRILDAADFGVPQHRRRVFVIGYKTGLVAPTYPEPDADAIRPTVWDAIKDLPDCDDVSGDAYRGTLGQASDYALLLRGEGEDPTDLAHPRARNGTGLTGCARTEHTATTVKRFAETSPGSSEPISRFYRLDKSGLSPTIRAGTGPDRGSFMAPRPIHPTRPRCITVREAARLHSYPDWFVFHRAKWHAFRQIGNSVPPLLARAVAKQIRRALRALQEKQGEADERKLT